MSGEKPVLSPSEAAARLSASEIPREIHEVVERLQRGGHAAVLVGGAVRDVLLGVERSDWDVATAATPEEVQGLFRKTVPTGVQHGTVTVLVGSGTPHRPVEVTTFRGEGGYDDGRRPNHVRFLRSLEDDLARRDFTINAFAWDPLSGQFTDVFDGLNDLASGLVRAVGEPLERFREDGLRTMRAVRFCATLQFGLEPVTKAAIARALDVLDRVSRERVRVELTKLLASRQPSLGLRPMAATGIWPHVITEPSAGQRDRAIVAVDRLPADPTLRLARLLVPVAASGGDVAATMDSLRPSKHERKRVLALTSPAAFALRTAGDPISIRRTVAELGPQLLEEVMAVHELDAVERGQVNAACDGAALSIDQLAVRGRDLIAAGIAQPGRELGDVLDGLFARVLEDPDQNDRDILLRMARDRG